MVAHSLIRDLNDILKRQLIAINQFFVHSKVQKKNGYISFASRYVRLGIAGGKVAEKLIEALVEHNELPQIKDYDLLKSHLDIQHQLTNDLSLVLAIVSSVHKCLKKCKEHGETQIEALLLSLLPDAEKQVDFLESQLSIIESIGLHIFIKGLQDEQLSEANPLTNYPK